MKTIFKMLNVCCQFRWQLPLSSYVAIMFFIQVKNGDLSISITKSDYLAFTSGMATILALFCSVSFGFVLHHIQNAKAERLDALNHLTDELNRFKELVYTTEESQDTLICEKLIFAYEDIESFDYPLREHPNEHTQFAGRLENTSIGESKRFLRRASSYVLNIEYINTRLQVILVQQVVSRISLGTLSKGILLITSLISVYLIALIIFTSENMLNFLSVQVFCTQMTILVFIEFIMDIRRFINEELDVVA